MSLNTDALTTVLNARVYLRRTSVANEDETNLLELLINAYSAAIHRYTERQFRPLETGVTKIFRYDGSGILDLAPWELRTVTSVVAYSDLLAASQRTLDPGSVSTVSEYRLEPRNKDDELTYYWITLPEAPVTWLGRHTASQVSVTGNWGVATVPADVEVACLIAVANAYRNPGSFASSSLGDYSIAEIAEASASLSSSLPADARALLAPYRRITI